MSAPHFYSTDRYCMVLSGVWWCNSGADFDPAACVPVPAGSYVRRVALTPHYDGAIRSQKEPAVIAICGNGPVNFTLSDPSKAAVAGSVSVNGLARRLEIFDDEPSGLRTVACWRTLMIGQIRKPRAAWL